MKSPQKKHFKLMCHLHAAALDLAKKHLNFDKTHPWHRNLVSLYGTILELSGSTCILIHKNVSIGVPILLRSVVEADLDFINLANDRKYGYHMHAAELDQWTKIFREARTGNNPFLDSISSPPNLDETLKQYQDKLTELKKKGFGLLTQKEKFDKAKLESVYRSVYNDLCCDSHNNIRALISRHINICPDQKDFFLEFYHPVDFEGILPYVDTFCGIIVSSTETLHGILRTKAGPQIEELRKQLDKSRKQIRPNWVVSANTEVNSDALKQ